MAADPRTYLWSNIVRFFDGTKEPSIDVVKARIKVGRGTVQRIYEKSAATRISSLTTIADNLGLEVWQLLVPGMDPKSPPRLERTRDKKDVLLSLLLSLPLEERDNIRQALTAPQESGDATQPAPKIEQERSQ